MKKWLLDSYVILNSHKADKQREKQIKLEQDMYKKELEIRKDISNKANEKDPNGLDAKSAGSKLDHGKSPVRRGLLEYFPRACLAVANVSKSGADKYCWNGWEKVEDGVDRYGDAEARHICKAAIEGPVDNDYGHHHAAHEAWNALARLELILREEENEHDNPH